MTVHIGKESLSEWRSGSGVVGTDEALVSEVNFPIRKYIVVRANAGNAGVIEIGPPGQASNGFILAAGEQTPPIQIDETDKVAVVGSVADQAYSWIAV